MITTRNLLGAALLVTIGAALASLSS